MPLTDPEDPPPLSPPSIPPEPIAHFRERDTEPSPANDIAAAVAEALRPMFAVLEGRITQLGIQADGTAIAVRELTELRKADLERLYSIDNGVGAALRQGEAIANDVAALRGSVTVVQNGVFAISADLQDLRTAVLKQADYDGEKRRELQQSVAELEDEAEQRRSVAGE